MTHCDNKGNDFFRPVKILGQENGLGSKTKKGAHLSVSPLPYGYRDMAVCGVAVDLIFNPKFRQ